MAVITTVFTADPSALERYRRRIDALAGRVLPSPLRHQHSTKVSSKRGYLLSVLGRPEHVSRRGFSVMAGLLASADTDRWWQIGSDAPDGSFCMVRSGDTEMEVLSDFSGSRTIWYVHLPCGGVGVSTAFEMLVGLLGDFQRDDRSLGWFLSSGTCGPRRSWDRRIKPLGPNARLYARRDGDAIVTREETLPEPIPVLGSVDQAQLSAALDDAFAGLDFGDKHWIVALSGGYDSRAILHGLRDVKNLVCVTWTDGGDHIYPGSDADIARQLARVDGREHVILNIQRPTSAASLDEAARRFVRYSDGRIDNLLAYVDGMKIWDELTQWDGAGLLRGDELFGSTLAVNEKQILQNMRLVSFREYAKDDVQQSLVSRFGHETPGGLQRRPGESTSAWRLRLRADFELPTIYAALNGVRNRFVDNVCPLLMRRLVTVSRSISPEGSDNKSLYKKVVRRMYEDVPFATHRSIVSKPGFLAMAESRELLVDYLQSEHARSLLGHTTAHHASRRLNATKTASNNDKLVTGSPISAMLPAWVRQLKQRVAPPPKINLGTLSLRSYLSAVVEQEFTETAAIARRDGASVESISA